MVSIVNLHPYSLVERFFRALVGCVAAGRVRPGAVGMRNRL